MEIQFMTRAAVIAPEPASAESCISRRFGLPLAGEVGGYLHSEGIEGCKSFGVWPLTQAARACFGTSDGQMIGRYPRRASSSRLPTPSKSLPMS
jgi:hypothetical protein